MKPKGKGWVRVKYTYGKRIVYGLANESSVREIHGIVIRPQPIRREIFVYWDDTFPPGYINVKQILRCRLE